MSSQQQASQQQASQQQASQQQEDIANKYVPRFILPDYIVRKQLKELEAEIASGSYDNTAHLEEMCAEYRDHLTFQQLVREAHRCDENEVSEVAVAHHGAGIAAARALGQGAAARQAIAAQPDQLIGNMQNAVDKDYLTRLERRKADKIMELPGKLVKPEFDSTTKHVYENALAVYQYLKEVHNRDSLDNHHLKLVSSVHYGRQYANAFWTPLDIQMVYGDGNPRFLTNIAESLDVAGHEMMHGIIDHEGQLVYENESGALNESIADVFGMMVKQWKNKHSISQSDWLIGAGTVPQWGKGLRSFTKEIANRMDIQPKTYVGIEQWYRANAEDVEADDGGVHLISGIPNHAFFLFCKSFKAADFKAYDGLPAKIWYAVVVGKKLRKNATFHEFAALTVEQAEKLGGKEVAINLVQAWADVGIRVTDADRAAIAAK